MSTSTNSTPQAKQPLTARGVLKRILAIILIVISGPLFLISVLVLISFLTSQHINGTFTASSCTEHYGSQINNPQGPPTCDGTFYPNNVKYQQIHVTANSDGNVTTGNTVPAFAVNSGSSNAPNETSIYIVGNDAYLATQNYLSTSYWIIVISLVVLLLSIASLAKSRWQRKRPNATITK